MLAGHLAAWFGHAVEDLLVAAAITAKPRFQCAGLFKKDGKCALAVVAFRCMSGHFSRFVDPRRVYRRLRLSEVGQELALMHHKTATKNLQGILLDGLKPGGSASHRDVHFLPYHKLNPAYEYDARKGDVSIFPDVEKLFEKHAVHCSSIGTILVCETIRTECFSRIEVKDGEDEARDVWIAGAGLPLRYLDRPGIQPKGSSLLFQLEKERWSLLLGPQCWIYSAHGRVPRVQIAIRNAGPRHQSRGRRGR